MDQNPTKDHPEVKRQERAHNKARLIELRDQAIETITRRDIQRLEGNQQVSDYASGELNR